MVRPANMLASVSSALLLVAQTAYSQATVNQQDVGLASGVLVQLGSSSASSFCTAYLGAPRTPTVTATIQGIATSGSVTVSSTITLSPVTVTSVAATQTVPSSSTWVRDTVVQEATSTAIETRRIFTTPTAFTFGTTQTVVNPSSTSIIYRTQTTTLAARRMARRQAATPVKLPKRLQVFASPVVSAACTPYLSQPAASTRTSTQFTATVGADTRTVIVTSTPPAITVLTTSTRNAVELFTDTSTSTSLTVLSSTRLTTQTAPTTTVPNASLTRTTTLASGLTTTTATVTRALYTSVPTFCLRSNPLPGGSALTPIFVPGTTNVTASDLDDVVRTVNLPFPVQIYGRTSSTIFVSTNGIIGFDAGNTAYTETALPNALFTAAIFPYFDDLFLLRQTTQGIYYSTTSTSLVLEFVQTKYRANQEFYHFHLSYSSTRPGVWHSRYYQISDGGGSCLVGMQAAGTAGSQFNQFGIDRPGLVTPGDALEFDTLANVIRATEFDGRCSLDYF